MNKSLASEKIMAKTLRTASLAVIVFVPTALVCVEYVYPFLCSFANSLHHDGAISLYNYEYALRVYGDDILFTLYVSLLSLLLVMTAAIFIGGWLIVHGNRFIEFLFKIPLFIPFVVVGHAMRTFLAPKGLLNAMLSQIGLVDLNNPPNIIYGALGIVISLTWKQMAFALLLVMGAYRSVDRSYLEAARNFGASTFRQITGILVPLSKGSVGVASVLIFSSFLQNFSTVMMMGNSGRNKHMMVDIYNIINYLNDLPLANALGVISYLLALGAATLYLREGMKKDA
jgi:ABC-type Fe3+ transport system permease subunit